MRGTSNSLASASDGGADEYFGAQVAIDGNRAVITAPRAQDFTGASGEHDERGDREGAVIAAWCMGEAAMAIHIFEKMISISSAVFARRFDTLFSRTGYSASRRRRVHRQ